MANNQTVDSGKSPVEKPITYKIQISNLDLDVTEDELADIFGELGLIEEIIPGVTDTGRRLNRARLTYKDEESMYRAIKEMNGYELHGRPLYISIYVPPSIKLPPLTEEGEVLFKEIVEIFNETEAKPQKELRRLIQGAGVEFTRLAMEEALYIEERGGLLVRDGSRRRTPGGVFFNIAQRHLAYRLRILIFQEKNYKQRYLPDKAGANRKSAKTKDKGKKVPEKKGKRQEKKGKPQKSAPAAQKAKPKPVQNIPPAPEPAETQELTVEAAAALLTEFRNRLEELKGELVRLKASGLTSGLFSLTKTMVNLQKKVNALLDTFPELS